MAAFVSLALVLAPGMGWAQEKIVRDAPDALRVEDMTEAELQQRLGEWEAGKRDDRDGYIVLNQIWFNLQAQRKTGSPEFQAVTKKRDDLLKKRPELGDLKDFRLSNKIQFDSERISARTRELNSLKAWVPKDKQPKGFLAQANRAVVVYQYRVEFFSLPNHLSYHQIADSSWVIKDARTPDTSPTPVIIPTTNPEKILRFKNNVVVYPRNTQKNVPVRLLICTKAHSYYSPTSKTERAAVRAQGHEHGLPWRDESAGTESFCGITDFSGNTVFEFPRERTRLFSPLDIINNGNRAAVLVGREVKEKSFEDGQEFRAVGNFSELLIWEYPSSLRRVPIKSKDVPDHVWYQKFVSGEL